MHTGILESGERLARDRMALVDLLACLVLIAMKTLVGVSSNSLAVLAGAAASGLGFVFAILAYVSLRSERADAEQARTEQVAVLLKSAVLVFACVWIAREALARLGGKAVRVDASVVVFGVLLLGAAVDFFRARAAGRGSHADGSEARTADLWRLSADSWISATILLGVGAVWAEERLGIPWLRHGDALAALAASATVLFLLLRTGARSIATVLPSAPRLLAMRTRRRGTETEGAMSVSRVGARSAGNRNFIDLAIGVPRTIPAEGVHAIAEEVEEVVRSVVPRSDLVVHAEPRARARESLLEQIRAIAQGSGLLVQGLAAHQVRDVGQVRLVLDLDAEVDERLTLREAHALVDRVEREIQRRIPVVGKINTRLAPPCGGVVPAASVSDLTRDLESHWREVHSRFPEVMDCHDVQVRRAEGRIVASCHATLDGSVAVTRAQEIALDLEDRARRRFPQIFRFTIHTEPPEAR